MTLYVFKSTGYEPDVIVAEAENKDEAIGKAVKANHGVAPIGEPEPLRDLLEDGAVKLA